MKIGISSDHGGYKLKSELIKYLSRNNFEVFDYGTANGTESVDYPVYAFKVGESVVKGDVDFGIVICSTGIGISIACNKVKGIRCAKVDNPKEAFHTRNDNDANVLALNGKMPVYRAKDIVDVFFSTNFSKAERHIRRINLISEYENNNDLIKKQIKEEKEKKKFKKVEVEDNNEQ